MMKKSKRITALLVSLMLLAVMTVVPMSITAQTDDIESAVKQAFESYVLQKGNEATASGLKSAVEKTPGLGKSVTVRESNFYIKHAVDGVIDEDPNEQTRINIPGSDGAVAAIIKVGNDSYGFTVPIKHKVENLGELQIANLGNYDGEDGTRIINWIGNGDTSKKYKVVVPENTSHVNTNGVTFESGNADNIVAIVFLEHKNKYGYESPRYGKFTALRAVMMADTITDFPVEYGFNDCKQLKYVHLPNGLIDAIPIALFKDCTSLENVNIPAGITRCIDAEAFSGTALREAVYPNVRLMNDAFANPSFTEGGRNLAVIGSSMSFPQTAAYSCAAVSQMKYDESTTAEDVENTVKSVWTNRRFNISWVSGFDSDASDHTMGGTIKLSKGSFVYNIDFTGYFYESELKAAVSAYAAKNGNGTTADGLLSGVKTALKTLTDDIELTQFYIKHAVNGVVDEDKDETTRINIAGSDGAIAAVFKVNGKSVGVTAAIRHTIENLGYLEIARLGDYPDPDNQGKRIINWIGNGNTEKKYKVVLPADTSCINSTGGLTFEGGNADNITALVMLGHKDKLPRYNMLSGLEAIVMSDDITGAETYFENGNEIYLSLSFAELKKLKYVHMSEGWNGVIPWGMFKDCASLENINLPKTINGYIEGYAFYGTALREVTYPDVGMQDHVFAAPALPEGEAGRNISAVGAQMKFIKAAAYAQAEALNVNFTSLMTEDDVKNAILNSVIYGGDLKPSWNDSFSFSKGDASVSGTLTVTSPDGDTVPISYSRLLSDECGLSYLGVKYFKLTPAFDRNVLEYTLSVPYSVTSLKITAEAAEKNASVGTITGADALNTGVNEIIVPVTAQNGKTANYKITVNRSSVYDPDDTAENRFKNASDSLHVTNDTTEEELKSLLEDIVRDENYRVEIADYYKVNAIKGAKDKDGIIVPAYTGYVAAVTRLIKNRNGSAAVKSNILAAIDGDYEELNISSVSSDADFELSKDGLTLMEYHGSAEKIIIPDGVEHMDDLWMVGDPAAVKVLILPETLIEIPRELCWGMKNLRACYMGNQIKTSNGTEFANCYKLQYVHLSEQIEEVGYGAFLRTFALTDVHIPLSVKTIRNMAFFNSFIRNVTLSGNVANIWEDTFSWLSYNPYHFVEGGNWGVRVPVEDVDEVAALIAGETRDHAEITVINKNLNYCSSLDTFQTDGSGAWASITVNSAKDSTTSQHIADRGNGGVTHVDTDMGIAQAAAQAMRYLDTFYVDNETSLYDVERAVMQSYYSTRISSKYKWSEGFKLTKAGRTSNGSVKGKLVIADNSVNEFELAIDRKFSLAPEVKSRTADTIIDNVIDNIIDSITDLITPDDAKNTDTIPDTENSGKVKKYRKKVLASYDLEPWVIPVIIATSVLGIAGITVVVIVIVKKRRKK